MLACASCGVPLQVEDGHNLCPKCLGVGHLREALTDPCMNCTILPLPVRENRLRQVENLPFAAELPPSGMPQPCSGRRGDTPAEECRSPRRKRPRLERPSRLEVDSLRAESSSPSRTSGTPSQTLGIGRGIPRVLEEMTAQVIPLGVQLALAQGRSHARYGQLFWQPWPKLTWTMHPWPGQRETRFFAGLRRPLRSRCHRRRPSWKSFSAAGGILEASPTMVETHGSWRACAILGIMVWTVIPGQLFGPEAERALERRRQASQAPEAWGGRSGAWDPLLRNPGDVTCGNRGINFKPPLPHSLRSGAALWQELGGSPGWNRHHLAGLWRARTGASAPPEAEAGGRGRPEGCRPTAGRFSQRRLAYWETHCKDAWV
ncbi:hypothetical protein GOODEAATRI_033479, partial [Goodea atripinnis]